MSVSVIRHAEEADLPALTAIYNEAIQAGFQTAHTECVTEENRREWLHNHQPRSHPIFVSVVDGTLAGYASLSAYRKGRRALENTAEISFYFRKEYHGSVFTNELVSFVLEECPKLNPHIRCVIAFVLGVNERSLRFLSSLGFEQWGRIPAAAVFDGVLIDHVILGILLMS